MLDGYPLGLFASVARLGNDLVEKIVFRFE